jgi:hypothetical protein
LAETFCVRGHGGLLVKGLTVVTKTAGFWEVEKRASSREVVEEADHFSINPFD